MLVVAIDEEGEVTGYEEVVELALGTTDALEGAEALQMGSSDVGDESAGGLSSLDECLDVARVGCSHLDHGNVRLVVDAEQRLGYADIVVEVTLGGHHMVAFGEHGTDEFLGGRLAIGACDAYHGDVELTTVFACQVLEGLQTVVDYNHPVRQALLPFGEAGRGFHNGIATAFLECSECKLVAIECVALQCQEDAAFRTVAGVGGDDGVLFV